MTETSKPKVFRRKRRFQGASWTPTTQSAAVEDGAWCKNCRKRHGYKTMVVQFERIASGGWRALWMCPSTFDVVEEMNLNGVV